ncbi:MAG TPA: CotH kinase family protein [Clostridia bacterium]
MRKKLTVVMAALAVSFLATCTVVWNYKESVFAAETSTTTQVASSNTEYNQFEMPIISINTDSKTEISSNEAYTDAKISIINDQGSYEMTNQSMSIKLRGNSSKYADKKSYKMKFGEKQNLLNVGDGKGKPWCLIANYYDGSLLRNLTAYHFADLLTGISYSPNCRSIELYVNGEYQGVYLLCEDVNVNKNRVAIAEQPNEVEKNGYLVEMSRYAEENRFEVDTATYEIKSDLSQTESIKNQQINYISNYIKESYNALKNGNQADVEKYINLDSLVDIYIGNEIVKNVDAGWSSFYMYKDVNGKLCFGPMWDFDLSMGNANCVKGFDSWAGFNPYNILNVNANSNPWFCHALSNKWFRELVKQRWNKLQAEINNIPNSVIKEAESNYKSYCRNFDKWNVLGRQVYIEPKEISALTTFKEHYTYLSNWLANRVKWLTEYYNSENFINGIFVNEDGNKLSANSNLLEMSSILALANSPEVEMTYELSPNTGTTMSIKNGGSEDWHTQSCATGFMIEKGTEYILSFDYICSAERPLSFAIQQNHGTYSPYYSGNLNITSKLQHYEAVFKASENDSNCALAFSLGGSTFNGTVVTIDKMSLVKKSPTVSCGDLNGDGKIDSSDISLLKRHLLRSSLLTGNALKAADVNLDGKVNSADYSLIKRLLLGLISTLPAASK